MLGVHHAAICTANVENSLRFWRGGLGLTEFFDHAFTGDRPELFGANSNQLHSIFLGDPQAPDCGIVELVELFGADAALPAPGAPRHGFFLLSPQRVADAILSVLWVLGFTDAVGRISMPAPAGKAIPIAGITAPDGALVKSIGTAA